LRIAALYDVHGNVRALEAVLGEVPEDVRILVGGDVAAGPFPQEAVDRLRALGERVLWIRGNADRELTPGEPGLAPPETMEWVRARLDVGTIEWLHELPATLELDVEGIGRVLFCHATPLNDVDIFTERTAEADIADQFAVDADLVVCGHTHTQFERTIGGVRVVNSGSVGMAYEDEPGAYWALLGPDVERRRTPYDLDTGDYPVEWPSATREEAVAFFETRAVGR
jgi:diadenosine tetraphosphatase ApaH/serine/threonine PP2A family protein phosphatase